MALALPDVDTVAIDTEGRGILATHGERAAVSLVSLAWRDAGDFRVAGDGIASMALPFEQGNSESLFGAANLGMEAWMELVEWLQGRRLVMHNAAHDLFVLRNGTVLGWEGVDLCEQLAWDSMLAAWVLEPREKIGLDDSAERHFGLAKDVGTLAKWKTGKDYKRAGKGSYHMAPMEVIEGYAKVDAELTWRLYEAQLAQLEVDSWARPIIDLELEVCRTISGMVRRGVGLDEKLCARSLADAKGVEKVALAKVPFQPVTEAEARRWFFETQAALPHCVTSGGQKSVQECCVRQLQEQGVKGAKEWAAAQKVGTAISMWYEGYGSKVGPDGRMRTDLRQTGTISMRWSSQRINLQAIPHDYRLGTLPSVRRLIVPKEGHELWEMDLSQAELRVAAKYADCKRMLALLESGADVHGDATQELFGVKPGDSDWKQWRNVSKRFNFSAIFSIGHKKLNVDVEKQTGIKLGERKTKDILEAWRSLYPEYPRANARAERLAQRRGYVKLAGGRLRWFQPWEELSKAFNQAVQGSLAEGQKRWAVAVDQGWPETLILTIHDSLLIECPEGEGAYTCEGMAAVGETICTDLYKIDMLVDVSKWGGGG